MFAFTKSFDVSRSVNTDVDLSTFDISLDSFDFEPVDIPVLPGIGSTSDFASASGTGFASAGGFASASGSGFSSVSGSASSFVGPDGVSSSTSSFSATGDFAFTDAFADAGPAQPFDIAVVEAPTIELTEFDFDMIEIATPTFPAFDLSAFDWGF